MDRIRRQKVDMNGKIILRYNLYHFVKHYRFSEFLSDFLGRGFDFAHRTIDTFGSGCNSAHGPGDFRGHDRKGVIKT